MTTTAKTRYHGFALSLHVSQLRNATLCKRGGQIPSETSSPLRYGAWKKGESGCLPTTSSQSFTTIGWRKVLTVPSVLTFSIAFGHATNRDPSGPTANPVTASFNFTSIFFKSGANS